MGKEAGEEAVGLGTRVKNFVLCNSAYQRQSIMEEALNNLINKRLSQLTLAAVIMSYPSNVIMVSQT